MAFDGTFFSSVLSPKFALKTSCHPERTGPQTLSGLGVVSRRIGGCSSMNFWDITLESWQQSGSSHSRDKWEETAGPAHPVTLFSCNSTTEVGCRVPGAPGLDFETWEITKSSGHSTNTTSFPRWLSEWFRDSVIQPRKPGAPGLDFETWEITKSCGQSTNTTSFPRWLSEWFRAAEELRLQESAGKRQMCPWNRCA